MNVNWLLSPLSRFIKSWRRETFLDESGHRDHVDRLTQDLIAESTEIGQRTGMRLFCRIPGDAANSIIGTKIDPYYQAYSAMQLRRWIEDHLLFDEEGKIIAIHDNNIIMWKHPLFLLNGKRGKV